MTRRCHGGGLVNFYSDFDAALVGIIGALASAIVLFVSACSLMRLSTAVLVGSFAVIIGSACCLFYQRINTGEVVQSASKVRP